MRKNGNVVVFFGAVIFSLCVVCFSIGYSDGYSRGERVGRYEESPVLVTAVTEAPAAGIGLQQQFPNLVEGVSAAVSETKPKKRRPRRPNSGTTIATSAFVIDPKKDNYAFNQFGTVTTTTEWPVIVSAQGRIDPVEAKQPGNEWMKLCGPANHDDWCVDLAMRHIVNHFYNFKEYCERMEGVKCKAIAQYFAPIGKPVFVDETDTPEGKRENWNPLVLSGEFVPGCEFRDEAAQVGSHSTELHIRCDGAFLPESQARWIHDLTNGKAEMKNVRVLTPDGSVKP